LEQAENAGAMVQTSADAMHEITLEVNYEFLRMAPAQALKIANLQQNHVFQRDTAREM
jgi:hypothetical protein